MRSHQEHIVIGTLISLILAFGSVLALCIGRGHGHGSPGRRFT